jgi:hypothetical protein
LILLSKREKPRAKNRKYPSAEDKNYYRPGYR